MPVASRERKKTTTRKPTSKAKPNQDGKLKGVSLPSRKNEPPGKLGNYPIFIFGEKGVGKTSLAAQFPDSIVFMWERGRRNLKIFQVPKAGEPALDWWRFKEYLELVKKDGRTPVIDTVDYAYDACTYYVLQEHFSGVTHPDRAENSYEAWNEIRFEWERTFDDLLDHGIAPIALSHARVKEFRPHTGEKYDLLVPTCTPACFKYFKSRFDYVWYYGYSNGIERWITLRGGEELIDTACGPDGHFEFKGDLLSMIPAGDSAKEAYDNILSAFGNKFKDGYTVGEEEE